MLSGFVPLGKIQSFLLQNEKKGRQILNIDLKGKPKE